MPHLHAMWVRRTASTSLPGYDIELGRNYRGVLSEAHLAADYAKVMARASFVAIGAEEA